MAITYKVLAGDGNQYGPVVQPELQAWVNEGRVTPATRVLRSDQGEWHPASNLSELRFQSESAAVEAPPPVTTTVAATPATSAASAPLETQLKSGASWFYWIAGLSVINSVVALTGSQGGFIVGLGVTQLIDAVGKGIGGAGVAVALVLDLIAAGMFVLFGVFAHRRRAWSFVVGMALYGLDGFLFLLGGDFLGVGFHAFALFCIFSGYSALRKLGQAAKP
jgi:hypothetical protein